MSLTTIMIRMGAPNSKVSHNSAEPSRLDNALSASEVAVWSLDLATGNLFVSGYFYELVPGLPKPAQLGDLLSLLSAADSYLFEKTFAQPRWLRNRSEAVDRHQQKIVSCKIQLSEHPKAAQLQFIGRLCSIYEAHEERLCYQGIAVNTNHWLTNPAPEYTRHLLNDLLSQSQIPTLVTDRSGNVLQKNRAIEKLFKLPEHPPGKIVGRYNLLHDKSLDNNPATLQKIKQVFEHSEAKSVALDYGLEGLHRNQLYKDINLHLRADFLPLKDQKGQLARVLVQLQNFPDKNPLGDLTDQHHLLRSLIDNSPNLISVKSVEGKYLLVNAGLCRWLGCNANDICGKSDFDLFDQSSADLLELQDQKILHGSTASHIEEVLSVKTGSTKGIFTGVRFLIHHADGEIYGIARVLTEISAQKMVEKTLENQREELHLLLDSMRSAIWYLDTRGIIKDANFLAREWLGDTELVGESFVRVATLWDNPAQRQRDIIDVIRSGKPLLNLSERVFVNGKSRWFNVDKIPTRDNTGGITGLLLVMTDITEKVAKERALEESESRYKAFIAHSSDAIWCYDLNPPVSISLAPEQQQNDIISNSRLCECNGVLVRMMNAGSQDEILGCGLIMSGSQNYVFDTQRFISKGYQLVDHDITYEDAKGRRLYYQISCVGVIEEGHLSRVWGTTKDVTARKRYEERLEYQSTHDALTKLPNRVRLYREIDQGLLRCKAGYQCALLLIDLDRFKEINDTLGHQVGDHLLQLIGPRLEAEIGETKGFIARLGGDEFAIFLPGIRGQRQAIVFAHRILDALRQEFNVDGFCTEISASIGIALGPEQAGDVSTMMRYADVAMYRAKHEISGISVYNAEYDPHSPKRLALMGELGRAIREDQLCLYFQPKISLEFNGVYGFEALVRWDHPELGFVPPSEFVPIVEVTSLIHPMTTWVLENSIKQCRLWHDAGLRLSIAVNLSARNLLDENFPKQTKSLLQKYQLPAHYLELEITESSIMTDPVRATHVLNQLHGLGVQLSIDDFGTGYSSLAYLKRLPVQTLKIDNSFVRTILDDKQDEVIVSSTVHLAHNLGLKVVAEGVENEEILQWLKAIGCNDVQGYHIGRPMPADKVEEWIENSHWCRIEVGEI